MEFLVRQGRSQFFRQPNLIMSWNFGIWNDEKTMEEYRILTVLAAFTFLYSIVASRLAKTPINGALVYLLVGLMFGSHGVDLIDLKLSADVLRILAEFTLALVLFTDSANANLKVLKKVEQIPIRLLLIGLPLTILTGFGVGWLLFDNLTLVELALLATILAPTDAALGKAVVTNPVVPTAVRESLNVESGLNDGICVPVLLVFVTMVTGEVSGNETVGMVARLPLQEIGIGTCVGIGIAILGGQIVRFSDKRGWIKGAWIQVPIVALAMFCFGLSQWLGGSGFIGSFVGGLVFGALTKNHKQELLSGAEGAGNVLSLLTWFTFGTATLGHSQGLSWQTIVFAILSLTVVRILPVFISLIGVRLQLDTKLFLGWFGPRGLASLVFIVMVFDTQLPGNQRLPGIDTLVSVVTWTITLSIFVHGTSAVPLSKWYGKRVVTRGSV